MSRAGPDPQGNARCVDATGRSFSYFTEHPYCSACLPAGVYALNTWARDASRGPLPFPHVRFSTPPPDAETPPSAVTPTRTSREGFVAESGRARRRAGLVP